MREIKFRAWDKRTGQMKPVANISFGDDGSALTLMAFLAPKTRSIENTIIHGESGILMQSTGLKDRHGREVYEGDVIEAILVDAGEQKPIREAVVWNEAYASYSPFNNLCSFDEERWIDNFWDEQRSTRDEHSFAVIGNIYEYPQLLEPQP